MLLLLGFLVLVQTALLVMAALTLDRGREDMRLFLSAASGQPGTASARTQDAPKAPDAQGAPDVSNVPHVPNVPHAGRELPAAGQRLSAAQPPVSASGPASGGVLSLSQPGSVAPFRQQPLSPAQAAGPVGVQLSGQGEMRQGEAGQAAAAGPADPSAPAGADAPADAKQLAALLARYPLEQPSDQSLDQQGTGKRPQPLLFAARANALAGALPSLRLTLDHAEAAASAGPVPDIGSFSATALEASLRKLSGARRLDRASVDRLLAIVPGIAAGREPAAPATSAAAGKPSPAAAAPGASAPSTALLMFTSPDCRHCQTMQALLGRLADNLAFPLLFMPLGSPARALYTQPGAQPAEEERARMQGWLDAASDWLVQVSGSRVTWVPCFVWVMDDEVRMATLNRRDVLVLAAWLNARCLAQQASGTQPARPGQQS